MSKRIENKIEQVRSTSPEIAGAVSSALPNFSTNEGVEGLRARGFRISVFQGPGSLQSKKVEHERFVEGVLGEISETIKYAPVLSVPVIQQIGQISADSINLMTELILNCPTGIEVCGRNPMDELPQLAKILFRQRFVGQPIPVVVPVCPDTDQYILKDGLGEVIPKALRYIPILEEMLIRFNFDPKIEIHLADVEALDSVILQNSHETQESHFAKTAVSLEKLKDKLREGAFSKVTARSMLSAFQDKGADYVGLQSEAANLIRLRGDRRSKNAVEGLLKERVRLGNFDHIQRGQQESLVVNELAGYAAYGMMINGTAIIFSPDAMSAVPAYQFGISKKEDYCPVIYAK